MATTINISVPDEQAEFLKSHGYSPSKLLQQKVEKLMEEHGEKHISIEDTAGS